MSYLWLLLFVVAMFSVVAFAAAVQAALDARRDGTDVRAIPVLGYVAVPPAVLTLVAYLVDRSRSPMGLWVVFGTSAFVGVLALAYAVRGRILLRRGL